MLTDIRIGFLFGIGCDRMNHWNVLATQKGLRPFSVDSNGLLCFFHEAIYRIGFDLKNPSLICNFPVNQLWGRIGSRSRLVDRIFRLTPSHAIIINNNLYISRRSEIWRCNLSTGQLVLDFVIPKGRRALEFALIEHPSGETQLIFGEYFSNPTRQSVNIWARSSRTNSWSIQAEFRVGEIEHVHAVTAIGDRVFILCGDFEHAASIWVTDLHFSSITPLLRGSQSFRAAWIAELGGRLFYATDTQLEPNHVFELCIDNGIWSAHKRVAISGSSIYSGQGEGNRYFSTAVECGMPTGCTVRDIFETRPGPGILSSAAKIMRIDSSGFCEEVFSAKKDALPFRLAQFGTFTFPTGIMPPDTVIAYGIALSGVDNTCIALKR